MAKRVSRILPLLALLVVLAGCGKKPNIVIVLVDTLRADTVGAYGYSRKVTPHIDELAKKSVIFKNAHAAASWTVPSVTSLFTGVYPWSHGVIYAEIGDRTIKTQQKLSDKFVTLAESFKQRGYATFCISANYHLHEQYGLAQGFDYDKVFYFSDREQVDGQVRLWLPEIKKLQQRGKPYLFYVHYFDPHLPYKYVEPFTAQVNSQITIEDATRWGAIDLNSTKQREDYLADPAKMRLIRDLYDGEVAAADDSVGKLLAQLPDLDNTLVVFISDHGEAFGEHQNFSHGGDLYTETLRVPLMVKLPKNAHAGLVVQDQVSLIDLYPTLMKLVGGEKPKYLAGVDLAPLWSGGQLASRMLFAMTQRSSKYVWFGAIGPQYKLLYHDSANRYELYDMEEDLHELNNVLASQRDIAKEYRQILAKERRTPLLYNPGVVGAPMSDELRKTLRTLGYL